MSAASRTIPLFHVLQDLKAFFTHALHASWSYLSIVCLRFSQSVRSVRPVPRLFEVERSAWFSSGVVARPYCGSFVSEHVSLHRLRPEC